MLVGQPLQAQQSEADHQVLAQLRAGAEGGNAEFQLQLGLALAWGKHGLARNPAEAVKWYRKAAEQNLAKAQYNLGVCYREGAGVASNGVEAVRWLRKAAEQNLPEAQHNLGVCYDTGCGVATNFVEAVKWYRKAAEQNLAEAQHNLGVCYRDGQGVVANDVEAANWFRRAAEQRHAPAQNELGICYLEGRGVEVNYTQAVKWFRQAAEQNEPSALMNLGICYGLGQGVRKDAIEAYKWWLLAAAQGHASARQNMLALEHQLTREQLVEGQTRAGDFKPQAAPLQDVQPADFGQIPSELLVKAEAGDAKAQNELGEVFYAGKQRAVRNPVEAVKWFRRAAEQNLAAAQCNLGLCYERGDGVAKWDVEAYKCYLLADAQGDAKAKRNASMLQLLLSPEELEEGKQRAKAWLEQHKKSSIKKT